MIKKIKKLCRLLCISALIGILLFPGQVMADRGGNSCRVTLPVSVIYRNQNSADSRVFEYVLSAKESGIPIPQETDFVLQSQMERAKVCLEQSNIRNPGNIIMKYPRNPVP